MGKVVGTFVGAKGGEECADREPEGRLRTGRHGTESGLELGKDLFDGVVIWGIRGEEEQGRPRCLNRLADRRSFVSAEIVQDDRVARSQRWD